MASSSSTFSPTPPTRGSPQGFKKVKKQQPFMLFAFEKQQSMPELRGLKAAGLAKNAMVRTKLKFHDSNQELLIYLYTDSNQQNVF